MKEKCTNCNVIIALSAVAFCLLLCSSSLSYLQEHLATAACNRKALFYPLVIGISLAAICFIADICKWFFAANLSVRISGCLFSAIWCFFLHTPFVKRWGCTVEAWLCSQQNEIAQRFSLSAGETAGWALAVLAWPFAAVIITILIDGLCHIQYKTFWQSFAGKISIKKILLGIGSIIAATILGVLLLLAAFSLPGDKIEKHVSESTDDWSNEGPYYSVNTWSLSTLDNFTDGLMLQEAADTTDDSLINRALYVYPGIRDYNPYYSLMRHYVGGEDYTETSTYERYWHGYLIFLRPLLTIINYQDIRILNTLTQILLTIVVCVLMRVRGVGNYIIPYLIGYLLLSPSATGKSLQYSDCFYLYNAGSLMLLVQKNERRPFCGFVFLALGIGTAYFDLLTYPVVTFGIPSLVLLALDRKETVEMRLATIAHNGISWCCGYVGMWAMKWLITSWITEKNVIANAMESVAVRTSAAESFVLFTGNNMIVFVRSPFIVALAVFVLAALLVGKKNQNFFVEQNVSEIVPFAVVAVLPLLWFAFASNHSSVHYWFTCKEYVMMVMALAFWAAGQMKGKMCITS